MLNAAEAMNLTAENLVLIEPKVEDYQILINGAIAGTQVTAHMATVLVVFDSRVQELELLYDALIPGAAGYTIDTQEDALAVITQLLTQTGARRLAVVAHGESGVIHIGATPLNREQLQAKAHLLQEWGVEEIALYSCEVGQDAGFVAELERLTGATVAAAIEKVGSAAQGGSWELTSTKNSAWFDPSKLANYSEVLTASNITLNIGGDGFINQTEAGLGTATGFTVNASGSNFTDTDGQQFLLAI